MFPTVSGRNQAEIGLQLLKMSLTQGGRDLLERILPILLEAISDEDLANFGCDRALVREEELGEKLMEEILVAVGQRGLHAEVVRRLQRFSLREEDSDDEVDEFFRPGLILKVLSRLPADVPPVETADKLRIMGFAVFGLTFDVSLAQSAAKTLEQIAQRKPVLAMDKWLGIVSGVHLSERMWPAFARLGPLLAENREALGLLLERLDSTVNSEERRLLAEIALRVRPRSQFRMLDRRKLREQERELVEGLVPIELDDWMLSDNDTRLNSPPLPLAELSSLALWRLGRDVAARREISLERRWRSLVALSGWALVRAARTMGIPTTELERARFESPIEMHRFEKRLEESSQKHLSESVVPRFRDFRLALVETWKMLDRGAFSLQKERVEQLVYWLRILRVYSPDPRVEVGYWPPRQRSPAQFPMIRRLLAQIPRAFEILEEGKAQRLAELETTFEAWMEAEAACAASFLGVHLWAKARAAEIAAEDGALRYETWYRELQDTHDRGGFQSVVPHRRSLLRWGLGQEWNEPPWWILWADSPDEPIREEQLSWLLEDSRERSPQSLCPSVRELVSRAAVRNFGFILMTGEVGRLLEELCEGAWVAEIADRISGELLTSLLEYETSPVIRAGLRIWAESEHAEILPEVVDLALEGPKNLRPAATGALDRWYERQAGSGPGGQDSRDPGRRTL